MDLQAGSHMNEIMKKASCAQHLHPFDAVGPKGYPWPMERALPQRKTVLRHRLPVRLWHWLRSEEHTSELQSLMRISYAVFCLTKQKSQNIKQRHYHHYYTYPTT